MFGGLFSGLVGGMAQMPGIGGAINPLMGAKRAMGGMMPAMGAGMAMLPGMGGGSKGMPGMALTPGASPLDMFKKKKPMMPGVPGTGPGGMPGMGMQGILMQHFGQKMPDRGPLGF